jgi:hypothetical protein
MKKEVYFIRASREDGPEAIARKALLFTRGSWVLMKN